MPTSFVAPEGYVRLPSGSLKVAPKHERRMHKLWKRSSVMWFSEWEPKHGQRWHNYYRKQLSADRKSGRLTFREMRELREYLDILGT